MRMTATSARRSTSMSSGSLCIRGTFQDECGQIVGEPDIGRVMFDGFENRDAELLGVLLPVLGENRLEAGVFECTAGRVLSLGYSVRVHHQDVTRSDRDRIRGIRGALEHAKCQTAAGRTADTLKPAIGAADERWQMSRVDE